MCCEQAFLERLREHGLRLTPQRVAILSVMHDLEGHASAEEIHARVQQEAESVDIATVYRTVELLEALHLAVSVDLGDGQRRFELLGLHGAHHHLLCRVCGRLERIAPAGLQPALAQLSAKYGFAAEPEHLVLQGVCSACRARESQGLAG